MINDAARVYNQKGNLGGTMMSFHSRRVVQENG